MTTTPLRMNDSARYDSRNGTLFNSAICSRGFFNGAVDRVVASN